MSDEAILINTNNGAVIGRKRLSVKNDEFYSFHQIPYGKPPVGELRFKVSYSYYVGKLECVVSVAFVISNAHSIVLKYNVL